MSGCFYCGSKEHPSDGCIQEVDIRDVATDAINQLGYSSMSQIVELFSEHKSGSRNLVSAAIYELTYEFRREYYEDMWQRSTSTEYNLLDYVVSITRGFVNIESGRPEVAISEFDNALHKAPTEVYEIRTRLLKAQAQYAAGNVDGAISTIDEGLAEPQQFLTNVRRAYDYQLARYYSIKADPETSISHLKRLIEGEEETEEEKKYFVKALIDEHFDNCRKSINECLKTLEKERKYNAQEMMELANSAIKSAKEWEVEVENAEANLEQARQQFETESYYGYLDAQSLAETSKDIASLAEKKQREALIQKASKAQENACKMMLPTQTLLEKLGSPQKQLELFLEQFQCLDDAQNHLSASHDAFELDNYCGYLLSIEKAEKTTNLANKIQNTVTEILQSEEEAEHAIADAQAALQLYALQYPENRRENMEKYESAKTILKEARQFFRKYTEENYKQCFNHIQKANQLIGELNQDAKFHDLRQETKGEIKTATQNLASIESEFQGQYDPHKFQFAQSQLEEARDFCELRTMEGYSRAIECAKEVNQLIDEMKEDIETQNLRETTLRNIESIHADLLAVEDELTKESMESELDEIFKLISESEVCTREMCEQAFEVTKKVKKNAEQEIVKQLKKKRNKKQNILTFSGFLGSGAAMALGVLGALFWHPAAIACFVVGGACFVIQAIVKARMDDDE